MNNEDSKPLLPIAPMIGPGLISVEESIEEVARKGLEAARRAEESERLKAAAAKELRARPISKP